MKKTGYIIMIILLLYLPNIAFAAWQNASYAFRNTTNWNETNGTFMPNIPILFNLTGLTNKVVMCSEIRAWDASNGKQLNVSTIINQSLNGPDWCQLLTWDTWAEAQNKSIEWYYNTSNVRADNFAVDIGISSNSTTVTYNGGPGWIYGLTGLGAIRQYFATNGIVYGQMTSQIFKFRLGEAAVSWDLGDSDVCAPIGNYTGMYVYNCTDVGRQTMATVTHYGYNRIVKIVLTNVTGGQLETGGVNDFLTDSSWGNGTGATGDKEGRYYNFTDNNQLLVHWNTGNGDNIINHSGIVAASHSNTSSTYFYISVNKSRVLSQNTGVNRGTIRFFNEYNVGGAGQDPRIGELPRTVGNSAGNLTALDTWFFGEMPKPLSIQNLTSEQARWWNQPVMWSSTAESRGNIVFQFFDEENEGLLTGYIINVSIFNLTTGQNPASYSTANGNLTFNTFQAGDYQIIYSARNNTINSQTHVQRSYYLTFNESDLTSNLTLALYTLNVSKATAITVTVNDQNGKELPGVIVRALKRYATSSGDIFKIVDMSKTNFLGEAYFQLQLTNPFYKYLVISNGSIIFQSEATQMVQTSQTIGVNLGANILQDLKLYRNIAYVLKLQNSSTTSNFSFTYNDIYGISRLACLKVQKLNTLYEDKQCDVCNASASGSLTCTITLSNGTYVAQGIIYADSTNSTRFVLDTLTIQISESVGTFTNTGVLYVMVIFMVLVMFGAFNQGAAIMMGILALGIGWALGLMTIPLTLIFSLAILGGIIMLKVKG